MSFNRDFIYTVPESILFDARLTIIDLKIYMIVRSFMDTRGQAYPSNAWIANKLGIDPRSVRRSIERLEKFEHLHRIEIEGRRYLMIGTPVLLQDSPEPESYSQGRTDGSGGGGPTGPGGEDRRVLQLDQNIITSNVINDHVKDKKISKTAKTEKTLTSDEKFLYEKLIAYQMRKTLALKIISDYSIAVINNIIEVGKENRVKNMGAYINTSIKNLKKGK